MKKQFLIAALCAGLAAATGIHLAAQNPGAGAAGGGGGRQGGGRGGRGGRGGMVTVDMKNAQGQSVGTATISGGPNGVSIAYDFKGLPAGEHALHIHQNAKCDPPDFMSAGGHFNPDMKKHGTMNPEGPHNGDMPNFTAAADGTAKGTVMNEHVAMMPQAPNSIFANGGTALMIHATADDMKTDPAGNAGARIACGTITVPQRGR
jgi:Cu-Zn family superoxide dismutase